MNTIPGDEGEKSLNVLGKYVLEKLTREFLNELKSLFKNFISFFNSAIS
ncbi:hypothetical protein [Haliea sp.]|nr:hypothetical protein [Haliea sp.]